MLNKEDIRENWSKHNKRHFHFTQGEESEIADYFINIMEAREREVVEAVKILRLQEVLVSSIDLELNMDNVTAEIKKIENEGYKKAINKILSLLTSTNSKE